MRLKKRIQKMEESIERDYNKDRIGILRKEVDELRTIILAMSGQKKFYGLECVEYVRVPRKDSDGFVLNGERKEGKSTKIIIAESYDFALRTAEYARKHGVIFRILGIKEIPKPKKINYFDCII